MSSTIGYPVTSDQRVVKMDQYIEEATFGVHPTVSPTFVDASVVRQFSNNYNNVMEAYRRMASRVVYKKKLLRRELLFNLQFSPVDTALLRYCSELGNAAGTLTGTVDKSLSWIDSFMQNSAAALVEHFRFREGTKCDSMTINIALGVVEVTQNWIARTIPVPVITANGGLTTPVFATPTTAVPWCHNNGGGASLPLVIDGVYYPSKAFSCTTNNQMDGVDINGSQLIEAIEPTTKTVTVTMELVKGKDLNLDGDVETFVADAASYLLNTGKTLTLTNLQLTNKTEEFNAARTSASTLVFAGTADDITITA